MSFPRRLLLAKTGDRYAVACHWNSPAAAVEDMRFAALTGQAVTLAGK